MTHTFSYSDRQMLLRSLKTDSFDLLVVGGGITGAGIARDAAMRGLKVALVEQNDFGSGTSSKSSKLIHGGLRYLEQMEFRLVFEGTSERALLMRQAPHLVRPLPFLFPVYEGAKFGPLAVNVGMWVYDTLALFKNYKNHRKLSRTETTGVEPELLANGLRASMLYYDCITDDARLTLETIQSAYSYGAVPLSYVQFRAPRHNAEGRVVGADCWDKLSGTQVVCNATVIISATGPWTNQVLETMGDSHPMVRPTKGVHIVVPRSRLPVQHAIVMTSVHDGRVVFAIPWEQSTVVGTTDTDYQGPIDDVYATIEDVDYLLETARHFFPKAELNRGDVRSSWAGLRPLVRDESDSPYDTSREHTITRNNRGYVTIAGGKLTTYRRMASECVAEAMSLLPPNRQAGRDACPTATEPLPGALGFDYRNDAENAAEEIGALCYAIARDSAEHLVVTYGAAWRKIVAKAIADPSLAERLDPALPHIRAEIHHAIEHEMALTLADFFFRRTHLHYHLADRGRQLAGGIADQMSVLLGWSGAQTAEQLDSYLNTIDDCMRWRVTKD